MNPANLSTTDALSPYHWHAARDYYFRCYEAAAQGGQVPGVESTDTPPGDEGSGAREPFVPCVNWQQYNQFVDWVESQDWGETRSAEWSEVAGLDGAIKPPLPHEVGLVRLDASDLVSMVVPVFNEERTVLSILKAVASVPVVSQVVVVNDASRDRTAERLTELEAAAQDPYWTTRLPGGLCLLSHPVNRGKGAALRTGFEQTNQPWIGVQDADEEYRPQDLMRLVATAKRTQATVVYGSRFLLQELASSPGWHRMGNAVITRLANMALGVGLTDVETCYKLIDGEILRGIAASLEEERFGIEIELTAKLAKSKRVSFAECPIDYDRRTYAEGKKIGIRDGFRALWCMLKYR